MARLDKAGRPVLEEGETACCYAQSEKSWINDPAGISWETFLTSGEATTYGNPKPQSGGAGRSRALLRAGRASRRATACCTG